MSSTRSAGWIFAESDQVSRGFVISDNGKTRHIAVNGLKYIDSYKANYTVNGDKVVIEDVIYYKNEKVVFKVESLNIKVDFSDLKSGAWLGRAHSANDKFYGNGYADVIEAGTGHDVLVGHAGNDKLYGGNGDDLLVGGSGSDYLRSGRGHDILTGGADSDIFDFDTIQESVVRRDRDTIADFVSGLDHIDLRTIDADTDITDGGKGNQAFIWIGGKNFSGVDGQLRLVNGILQGDTNGDRQADFEINVVVNKLVVTNSHTSDIWL
jgi:hypothetical protein